MTRRVLNHFSNSRYSARAAITFWLVAAGFVWLLLGLVATYAAHLTEDSVEADADHLSKINPAAAAPSQALAPAAPSGARSTLAP